MFYCITYCPCKQVLTSIDQSVIVIEKICRKVSRMEFNEDIDHFHYGYHDVISLKARSFYMLFGISGITYPIKIDVFCDYVPLQCRYGRPCDPRTQCVNTVPGFHCSPCPPGYRGDSVRGVGITDARGKRQVSLITTVKTQINYIFII